MIDIVDKFECVSVLVIGDVMLDRYWWGGVSRISPEAPVPVVRMTHTTLAAGGAANVAANVAGLGAKATLVGIVGDDAEARLMPEILGGCGVSAENLIPIPGRPTTVKTRIVAHSQHVARIDQESEVPPDDAVLNGVVERLRTLIPAADAIVLSDYAKGFLSVPLLAEIIGLAGESDKPVLVDPKGKDYAKYKGATLLTPNRREAADACGLEENDQRMVEVAGGRLLGEFDFQSVLITQGEHGMTLFSKDSKPYHLETHAREVYDVTGAGDTVIGTLAVAIGAGADLRTAANLANVAAGSVVEQVGTTAIDSRTLSEALAKL